MEYKKSYNAATDPTTDAAGFHRVAPATRGRLAKMDTTSNPFFRGATAKRCVALTPCMITTADGRTYAYSRKTARKTDPPANSVKIRKRVLRAPIAEYIGTADRVGLNVANVRRLYELRADNGYHYQHSTETNETYSFHGAEV